MSKELLKTIFDELPQSGEWAFQLLKINTRQNKGEAYTTYVCREIHIHPEKQFKERLESIAKHYVADDGLDKITSVDDYTGDVVGNVIYKLPVSSELISTEYNELMAAISNPDMESNIEKRYSAYMIKCSIDHMGESVPVKLFSMQSPISYMTNKFLWFEGDTFRAMDRPVLSLRDTVDAALIGDTFYMFNMQAENLFHMERGYKTKCRKEVEEIAACQLLTNADVFRETALSGHNPRRFVSFNSERLNALKNPKRRKKLAEKFKLPMKGNLIDTEADKASERLVKFLCNKAMLDPLDEAPVEVAAAKGWT